MTLMIDRNPPDGTVGERIRALLAERRMSQRRLAAALAGDGASAKSVENMRRQISSWVNDQHAPSRENAEALAEQLDVPAEWLIDAPRRTMSAALDDLAQLLETLTEHVEAEQERSEDAVRVVRDLDRRLALIEAVQCQLLEGQLTAAGAIEEMLMRLDVALRHPEEPRGQSTSS